MIEAYEINKSINWLFSHHTFTNEQKLEAFKEIDDNVKRLIMYLKYKPPMEDGDE